jgi:aminopeptidase-like protein
MLAKWLISQPKLRYTYRIIFIPETIGSICYLSRHLGEMRKNTIAGFNISCIGDDRDYSYLPSKNGNTLTDRVALHVLKHHAKKYTKYSFLDRRSDERQYCSSGVDLPVVTVARTLYWNYPEYHTSLDDLTVISPEGLGGGYMALRRCIECIEENKTMVTTTPCEPQLGRRGMFPTLSKSKGSVEIVLEKLTAIDLLNMWAYCDGNHDLLDIADKIQVPFWDLLPAIKVFLEQKLLVLKV